MHDFRRTVQRAQLANTPELTLEIRRAHDRREWALELLELIEEQPPKLGVAIALAQEPETAAGEIRRFLNVTLDAQTSWRTDYEAFKQWRLLIERAGVLTFQANNVETAEARGFSISDILLPVAVANIKDAPRGRIFTLLHEVTHILLRDGGICDLRNHGRECDRKIGRAPYSGCLQRPGHRVRAHARLLSRTEVGAVSRSVLRIKIAKRAVGHPNRG